MRPIDADALKKTLEDMCSASNSIKQRRVEDIMLHNIFPQIVDDEPTIEVEPVDRWISIKDRLPEPETWVMVYIKYPSPVLEMERGIQKMSSIKKMFYDGKSFYCDFGTITHWQFLPEPPKEDAE